MAEEKNGRGISGLQNKGIGLDGEGINQINAWRTGVLKNC